MSDFGLNINFFLEKLNNIAIKIEDQIIIKVINFLSFKFEIYIIIVNKKAYNKKVLLDLNIISKN